MQMAMRVNVNGRSLTPRVGLERWRMEAACAALTPPTCLNIRGLRHCESNLYSSSYPPLSLGSLSPFGIGSDHVFSDIFSSPFRFQHHNISCASGSTQDKPNIVITTKRRSRSRSNNSLLLMPTDGPNYSDVIIRKGQKQKKQSRPPVDVRSLQHQNNGDPLGRRDLGKSVVKWITQGMKAMAADFGAAELQGEFPEVRQRMGPGLTFVIQAQPYLNAIPMPLGFEAVCLKACTHYPTLFDHFQRELRDVLQELMRNSLVDDWRQTESWKLLKELANSDPTFPPPNYTWTCMHLQLSIEPLQEMFPNGKPFMAF